MERIKTADGGNAAKPSETLLFPGNEFSFLNFGLLIGLPAVIIYGSRLYLGCESSRKISRLSRNR